MPNPLTLDDLLPILNLPCGDVLKAHLLAHFHPSLPKLNPIWLQGSHRGEAEAAAAAARKALEGLPAPDRLKAVTQRASADDALQAFKADHKPSQIVAEPGMMLPLDAKVVIPMRGQQRRTAEEIKQQIAEGLAQGKKPARDYPTADEAGVPQSFDIDGREYVTISLAGKRLNLGRDVIYGRAIKAGIESRPSPHANHLKVHVYPWKELEKLFAVVPSYQESTKPSERYPTSFQIEGREWVTIKEASRRLGLKDQAVYYQCTNENVPVRPAPSAFNPLTKVYLWERVQAALASKKKPVDK